MSEAGTSDQLIAGVFSDHAAGEALNAALVENPPPKDHALLLRQFATIGIGPGLDVEAQPEVVEKPRLSTSSTWTTRTATSSPAMARYELR